MIEYRLVDHNIDQVSIELRETYGTTLPTDVSFHLYGVKEGNDRPYQVYVEIPELDYQSVLPKLAQLSGLTFSHGSLGMRPGIGIRRDVRMNPTLRKQAVKAVCCIIKLLRNEIEP